MLHDENLFPLIDAVQKATGRRPHLSTVLRWCSRGSAGVRLECRVLGGRRLTSPEAVVRYMDNVTAAKDRHIPQAITPPRQAERAAQRSAEKLAKRIG